MILYYLKEEVKLCNANQYRFTIVNCLLKIYINDAQNRYYCSPHDNNLTMQENMERGAVESASEKSIKKKSKDFPSRLD